jgi:hypothetical protein
MIRFFCWVVCHPLEDILPVDVDENEPVTAFKGAIRQAAAPDLDSSSAISLGLYKIIVAEKNLELGRITADSLKDIHRLLVTGADRRTVVESMDRQDSRYMHNITVSP